jgi:hypothetical protein
VCFLENIEDPQQMLVTKIKTVTERALATGALQPFVSKIVTVRSEGIEVRVVLIFLLYIFRERQPLGLMDSNPD